MNKAEIMALADGYAIAVAQAPHSPRPLAKKLAEQRIEKARDALVAVLEQTEQQAEPDRRDLQAAGTHPAPCARHCEARAFEIEMRSLNSRLKQQAEPVQEPFGYLWPTGSHPEFRFTQQKRDGADGMPLYTAPPQQQAEPVAWTLTETLNKRETTTRGYLWFSNPQNYSWTPLYTAPPQRKPLTCLWSPEDDDTMPSTYRSACGELWSFIDGGWKDNRVKFCHGCGGKVVEASSVTQEPKP